MLTILLSLILLLTLAAAIVATAWPLPPNAVGVGSDGHRDIRVYTRRSQFL